MAKDNKITSLPYADRPIDAHAFIDELIDNGATALIVLGVNEGTKEEPCRAYSYGQFGFAWNADRVFVAQQYIDEVMENQRRMVEDIGEGS